MEDGTRHFIGWRDTELGIDCAFAHDTEGTVRCLPIYPSATSASTFIDAACTQPSVSIRACTERPSYAVADHERVADPCDPDPIQGSLEVHALGDVVTALAYFGDDASTCTPLTTPVLTAAIGDVVPLERFVAADVERLSFSGRLQEDVVVASDGARQRIGFFDTLLAERCWFDALGGSACVPSHVAFAEVIPWRAGSDCARKLVHDSFGDDSTCPAPRVVSYNLFDGCESSIDLWTVGAPYVGEVFSGSAAWCQAEGPRTGFFELGAPVAEDAYVRARSETHGMSGARVRVLTIDGLVAVEEGVVTDTGATCTRTSFADGVSRCIDWSSVAASELASHYADAACTTRLFPQSECSDQRFVVIRDLDCNEIVTSVFALDPVTPEAVFSADGGTCMRVDDDPSYVPLSFRRVGAELPFDTFPRVALVIE